MKNLLTKKDHTRRYYLHGKVKQNYATDAHKREVSVPVSMLDSARNNKYVMELCSKFGYNIQASIV